MYSATVVATRGIVAGSGFATAEMRLAMIHTVDVYRADRKYLLVEPTLRVDDLSFEVVGTINHIIG